MVDTKPKNILRFLFKDLSLKMMIIFKDISGGVVFPWIFIWKKPKAPECLAGRYPLHDAIVRDGTASSAWICWLSAIGALFILWTICIPSLFGGKWRNAQQNHAHFRMRSPNSERKRSIGFLWKKKEAKCLKLICWLSYLWEITMKEPFGIISLWLFSQPFSEQIPEWCP